MYPQDVSEVVVIELIANALDAGATQIGVNFDKDKNVLEIQDNGNGMTREQFAEYHDFAAGLKTRGSGIGFAGVGAKISFNIAHRVVTKTISKSFAGGSGAALSLLLQEKVKKIIINDLDPAIYSFWLSAIVNSDQFINKIELTSVNITEWRKQKEVYRNKDSSKFDLGFATFFLNRTNRSGIVEGGPIGGIKQKGRWKIDARFNKKDLINRIKKISYYKDRITVTNEDGLELLKKIKKLKKMFIYLDPPYYEKGGSLYLNSYNEKDHKKLANFLNNNSNVNWLLTYDNVDYIKNLYLSRKTQNFSINYSVHEKRRDLELMIFSDSLSI